MIAIFGAEFMWAFLQKPVKSERPIVGVFWDGGTDCGKRRKPDTVLVARYVGMGTEFESTCEKLVFALLFKYN